MLRKVELKFKASIPGTRRAFEVPGSRTEFRVTFELPETEVPKALGLVLLRGQMFRLILQEVHEMKPDSLGRIAFRKVQDPLYTMAAVSPKNGAIRINGGSGMTVILDFPGVNSLSDLLNFREKLLHLTVQEVT